MCRDFLEMHELYVKLMCQFAPEAVLMYLMSQDNYPLESCLKLCKSAGRKFSEFF